MPPPNMEDPAWNRKREALETEFNNALLKLLDHMGWPGGLILPLNSLDVQIKLVPTTRKTTNAN